MNRRSWNYRLQQLERYFLCFLIYSFIGWAYEVFLEVVVYQWGYSDRGVLFGPYCPVYGFGALTFLLCLHRLLHGDLPRWLKPFLVFLSCALIATAIELVTSYVLEALTGSWPWQTYRDYQWNFQGRIALSPSIRFGLGGALFLYGLQPLLDRLTGGISRPVLHVLSGGLSILFLLDCVLTAFL